MKKIYYLGLLLLLISTASVKAQVTIGKDTVPHGGALLDLQQPDATKKLGLKLPVVSLSDATEYCLTSGEKATAVGMVVYNSNPAIANGYGTGVYVWDGAKWNAVKGADPCEGNYPVVGIPANDTLYTVNLNQAQTLTVEATSPDGSSLTYLWQSSPDNSTWTEVSDATEDTYSAPVSAAGTIYYRCRVTNPCGTTVSKVFTVIVRVCSGNPSVGTPANDVTYTVNLGQAQTLTVAATSPSGGSLSYLWQSSPNNSTWTDVPNATATTYSAPVSAAGTTYYRCNVTNPCGTTASKVFTVIVRVCSGNPSVGTPANDVTYTVNLDQAQTLTVAATSPSGGGLSYLWQSSSDNSTWTDVPNATATTYSAPVSAEGTTYYRCNVTNPCGTTASKVFTVIVRVCSGNPTVGTPANDVTYTVNLHQTQTLTVAATSPSGGSLSYLWQSSSDNSTWTDVSDAIDDATYSAPVSTAGTTYYRCNVTNPCGTTVSKIFTVTVQDNGITVGSNNYQVFCYPNSLGCWMENSKEGTAAQTQYTGQGIGERGYYYNAAQAAGACPTGQGFSLPTDAQWDSLFDYFKSGNATNSEINFFCAGAALGGYYRTAGPAGFFGWNARGNWRSTNGNHTYYAYSNGTFSYGYDNDPMQVRCVKAN